MQILTRGKRKNKRPLVPPPKHRKTVYFYSVLIRLFPNDLSQLSYKYSEFKAVKVSLSLIHKLGLFIKEDIREDAIIIKLIRKRVAAKEANTLKKHY